MLLPPISIELADSKDNAINRS